MLSVLTKCIGPRCFTLVRDNWRPIIASYRGKACFFAYMCIQYRYVAFSCHCLYFRALLNAYTVSRSLSWYKSDWLNSAAFRPKMAEIILDPSIRDWVVFPMLIIFVCSAMLRHYVTLLLKSDTIANADELRPMWVIKLVTSSSNFVPWHRNTIKRAQITRMNSKFIDPDAYAMRKVWNH